MTIFDILFYSVVLFAILIGIALGVHLAYCVADIGKEDDYADYQINTQPIQKSKTKKAKNFPRVTKHQYESEEDKDRDALFAEDEDFATAECHDLKARIHDQKKMPYSEFDCQFTGEDYNTKLVQQMQQQEMAYNYMEQVMTDNANPKI